MPRTTISTTEFVCDECENKATTPENAGPWVPEDWLNVNGSDSSGDWFCQWQCLAKYATRKAKEKKSGE